MERRTSKFWTSNFESVWPQLFWTAMQLSRLYLKTSETASALLSTQHGLKNAEKCITEYLTLYQNTLMNLCFCWGACSFHDFGKCIDVGFLTIFFIQQIWGFNFSLRGNGNRLSFHADRILLQCFEGNISVSNGLARLRLLHL